MTAHRTVEFRVGETAIAANVFEGGPPGPTFLNVHDDEDTAVAAGLENLREFGGRLIELAHAGTRLITFTLGGQTYTFDPNRIFSDRGIVRTLEKESRYSPAAHAALREFAADYLRCFALDREPVILALHNITDSPFSVRSYLPGAEHAASATAIHLAPTRSRFDFFFTTDPRFFEWLRDGDFNVVLQDSARVEDDGSLSVYFARLGIPYLNVEAELGHLAEQVTMLRAARRMLSELAPGPGSGFTS